MPPSGRSPASRGAWCARAARSPSWTWDRRARGALLSVLDRRLRVSSTRCGDLRAAADFLAAGGANLGRRLGARMMTDVLPTARLADAFARAGSTGSVKVVVTHPGGLLRPDGDGRDVQMFVTNPGVLCACPASRGQWRDASPLPTAPL
jgi:hypothetical protein